MLVTIGGGLTIASSAFGPGPAMLVAAGLVASAWWASRVARRITNRRLVMVTTLSPSWRVQLTAAAHARRRALIAAARMPDGLGDGAELDSAVTTALWQAVTLLLEADDLRRELASAGIDGADNDEAHQAISQAISQAGELLASITRAADASEDLARAADGRQLLLADRAKELRLATFRAGRDLTVDELAERRRALAVALRRLQHGEEP
ncbi:MAG TPA: hypothetical protein VLC50_04535 [Actinomycetes bacterium]|nr:hypothetical protein [Actinomycetes bacterium]